MVGNLAQCINSPFYAVENTSEVQRAGQVHEQTHLPVLDVIQVEGYLDLMRVY